MLSLRKRRNQVTYLGVAIQRAHLTNFLTLWEPNCTYTEEGWELETLHWLSGFEKNHNQEHIPDSMEWWPYWLAQGGKVLKQDWFEVWLSPSSNRTHRCMEDYLQVEGGCLWVVGHSLWFNKCPQNFYEANGWHLATFHQLIHGFISRWYPHI